MHNIMRIAPGDKVGCTIKCAFNQLGCDGPDDWI